MQSTTTSALRRLTRGGIDTRYVLLAYAFAAIVMGFSITGTGIWGLPGVPQARASVIWIIGMVMIAAGCAAVGLLHNLDPASRRRSIYWFAAGHVLLGLFVWMQWSVYWVDHGVPLPVALSPLLVGVALFATTAPSWLQSANDVDSTPGRIRSTYDEHIRQIARREERARLARDLHDAVKQQLFVIQTAAATVQERFDEDRAGAREALGHVRTAAREAASEMEALLDELQAAPLENTGMVEALKKQCEALAFRTGADVRFDPGVMPPPGALRPGSHEAIYRIAQEALANVARHARATRVTVSLGTAATQFEMRITDNGAGFDPLRPRRGMGISNMEARAAEIGGRVLVTPTPEGTDVRLGVPLANSTVPGAWGSVLLFGLVTSSMLVVSTLRGEALGRSAIVVLAMFAGLMVFNVAVAIGTTWWRQRSR